MKRRFFRYPLIIAYSLIGKILNTDERIAKRLPDYFPTYSSFFGELLNQAFRLTGSSRSFLPQGIIVEPTNHCNLKCKHCSAQVNCEARGYMGYDFYKHVVDTNPQVTCLMLSRYGEPFLHPRIFDMIEYAKKRNIYVFIYTNGILLTPEKIDKVLESGLDEINFSLEGIGEVYQQNRGVPYSRLQTIINNLLDKKKARRSLLKVGINIARIDDDAHNVEVVSNEWANKVDYIDVEPLIGKKAAERNTTCRTLWRNAAIRWDGIVFPCCIDMEGALPIGDLKKNTLKEIFNGPTALSLRKCHLKKAFPPVCKYCDALFG